MNRKLVLARGAILSVLIAAICFAAPSRAADSEVIKTKGWRVACKIEFCTILQSYPPSVTGVNDPDAERPALVYAIRRAVTGNDLLIVFALPLDVDIGAGVSIAADTSPGFERRVSVSGCDKDECYLNVGGGIIPRDERGDAVDLDTHFKNQDTIRFSFTQNGKVVNVSSDLSGFAKNYQDVLEFFRKNPK